MAQRLSQGQFQQQVQTQKLALTQEMRQAIELTQKSELELEAFIEQELLENPALDREDPSENSDAPDDDPSEGQDDALSEDEVDWDALLENSEAAASTRGSGFGAQGFAELPDIGETQASDTGLRDYLMQQLHERLDATAREREVGQAIIFNLEDDGYLRETTCAEIAALVGGDEEEVEDVLTLVQELEPAGVAARSVEECLYLQAVERFPRDRALKTLITHSSLTLSDLADPDRAFLQRLLSVDAARLDEVLHRLRELTPHPASAFVEESTTTEYVSADVRVIRGDSGWEVVSERDPLSGLQLSRYDRVTLKERADSEARNFVRQKVNRAAFLMRSIEQRRRTILNVAREIVRVQAEFLESGFAHLDPLVLADVASAIGVHESTVSRACSGKYMDTPLGLFPFRYFFNPAVPRENAPPLASESVRHLLKGILATEDRRRPLSDARLVDRLYDEHAIMIARRTVAKYREALGYPSSSARRVRAR